MSETPLADFFQEQFHYEVGMPPESTVDPTEGWDWPELSRREALACWLGDRIDAIKRLFEK